MLLAFLIYNDGIATIQRMATAYGTEIGLPQNALITAIVMVQFIGIPCTLLFGMDGGMDRHQAGDLRRAGRFIW